MSNVRHPISMRIAAIVSTDSFEAAIVGKATVAAIFKNSQEGVKRFQSWTLCHYRRWRDIEIHLWESELGVGATLFPEQAVAGKVLFRSPFPWRSASGLVSVDYVGHSSAVVLCRRFGYETVQLEAVLRRARGEFPRPLPDA
jgi:hypothetical protein